MTDQPIQAMGHRCAVHVHRNLVPLERHHIWPKGEGGPDIESNIAVVCANGHSAIHDLLAKMRKGPVPWRVRLLYGYRTRRLAKQGLDAINAQSPPR